MVGEPRLAGVHLRAAEGLVVDVLVDRHLHQRRPAQVDRRLAADEHRVLAHPRHVGAAGGRRAEDQRDRRDALRPRAASSRGTCARPGTNRSAWRGRSAPPDSTSATTGSRLRSAISRPRSCLVTPIGVIEPPFTVGSLATIRHSTPLTAPIPTTSPAPGVVRSGSCAPASAPISRKRGVRVEEQVDALARGEPAALVVAVDVLRPAGGEHRRGHLVDARERGQHRLAVRRELRRRRVEARARGRRWARSRERSCPHRVLPRRPGERLADLHPLPRDVAGDHEAGVVDVPATDQHEAELLGVPGDGFAT